MKQLALFLYFCAFFSLVGCEDKMKEHPLPETLKKELARKSDPNAHKNDVLGTISMSPNMGVSIHPSASLFIFARPEGVEAGPPLAVRKHGLFDFPFEFEIGQLNTMMEGSVFEGNLTLTARLDQDGNRKSSPGDVEGKVNVQAGEKGVKLVLDSVVEGATLNVQGTVRVSEGLKNKIKENAVLFLFARSAEVKRGPPLAVQRIPEIKMPYEFKLGAQDVMFPGTNFEGPMVLTGRIDSDGDARAGAGDIEGFVKVKPGDKNVELLLNHLTSE
ncbi:MAG: hypothetical protein H8E32_06865 [Nitrospinae bacterium]|nr:hypothetical protein [Nitrospinota bacterium]